LFDSTVGVSALGVKFHFCEVWVSANIAKIHRSYSLSRLFGTHLHTIELESGQFSSIFLEKFRKFRSKKPIF